MLFSCRSMPASQPCSDRPACAQPALCTNLVRIDDFLVFHVNPITGAGGNVAMGSKGYGFGGAGVETDWSGLSDGSRVELFQRRMVRSGPPLGDFLTFLYIVVTCLCA